MRERISPEETSTREDYVLYLRHLFAYEFACETLSRDWTVLEIGCGEGYGSSLLSKHVRKVVALDVKEEVLEAARRKYGSATCSFQPYDGKNIPFESDSFDSCVLFQVIEHVEDDKSLISEVHKVLRKEGVLILTTPNRAYRLSPEQKPFNPSHKREYYHWELERLLKLFFREVRMSGISATEELRRIEIERVRPYLPVSLDRANLRRFLPREIRGKLGAILKNITHIRSEPMNFRETYTTSDFHIIEDAGRGLDILAICSDKVNAPLPEAL